MGVIAPHRTDRLLQNLAHRWMHKRDCVGVDDSSCITISRKLTSGNQRYIWFADLTSCHITCSICGILLFSRVLLLQTVWAMQLNSYDSLPVSESSKFIIDQSVPTCVQISCSPSNTTTRAKVKLLLSSLNSLGLKIITPWSILFHFLNEISHHFQFYQTLFYFHSSFPIVTFTVCNM